MLLPAWLGEWLASGQGRLAILVVAMGFSFPAHFANLPELGLDPSWQLSLQSAAMQGKVFGREFVFTYGPLGWLPIHFPVNKLSLLAYDFFILGSLLLIYRTLLPECPNFRDALLVIGLAIVTKTGLLAGPGPSVVLFNVFCYWLWRVYDRGDAASIVGGLISALLLFFTKVNYGLITIFLVPAFGLGLLLLPPKKWLAGLLLIFGFPLLVVLGAVIWKVDLPGYLVSAKELIAGYNEAMFLPAEKALLGFELAVLFLLAAGLVAFLGRHRLPWSGQVMLFPLIGLACLLLFKNAFVRFDPGHTNAFHTAFPLLLALWLIAWRSQDQRLRTLLVASLLYPLALLVGETEWFGSEALSRSLPLRYWREVVRAPWRSSTLTVQQQLQTQFPEALLAGDVRDRIGKSSVDIMPWETSIAVLNGLQLQQRPVPQSYSVYTPWLDTLNARFLASHAAPDLMLYAGAQCSAIDARPAAWDESLTKRALLENYTFDAEFKLPIRVGDEALTPAPVFVLKHTPASRRLVPVLTNEVSLALNQSLPLPVTTNLIFITLKVNRTLAGRIQSFILSPSLLKTVFEFQDGSSTNYRAVLPILQTGVLVNRRVESPDEIRNWLQLKADKNMAISTIRFTATAAWAFQVPFKGTVVEYRLE